MLGAMTVTRLNLPWLLVLLCAASIGFIAIKEIVDPMRIIDLKIDEVRFGQLPTLASVLELFVQKHGQPPGEREGLAALVCSQPAETNCIPHLGPDPWLHPYMYRLTTQSPGYMVYSVGANGIDERGGGDDIVTWPKQYSCREYGVGCPHIADKLEFGALGLAMLSGLFLLVLGGRIVVGKVRKVFS